MTTVTTMPSNSTGLAYAEEASAGVLPTTPDWLMLEPNKYDNFGGEVTLLARNPINQSRQRKKGVVVDLKAEGGFEQDFTQTNMQKLMQGFLFADLRTKAELSIATLSGSPVVYAPASGGGAFKAGDLLFAKGFTDARNNGLKTVSAAGSTSVAAGTLYAGTSQEGTISRVGFQFGSADLAVDTSGALPALTTSTKDLTELGLVVGEFIFIGGDTTVTQFATAANNCWARVRSIAAHKVELDKSSGTLVSDAGTGKTIRVFMGRVLKNEIGSLIKRRTYQLERQLGAPDKDVPAEVQAEYVIGCVPSKLEVMVNTADKVTSKLEFMGQTNETRDAATGLKSGNRPALLEADAFNTSSDIRRIRLAKVIPGTTNPDPLFAYVQDLSIAIDNKVSENKAVGYLGSIEITEGTLEVSASMNAYFADVAAIQAIKDNDDITLDMVIFKNNAGIAVDLPLCALGDGRPKVDQDKPITIPLDLQAATGAKIDTALDHTIAMTFYDYLPTLARV